MKLHKAIKKCLEEYGEVREERFTAVAPRRDGIAFVVEYPAIEVEIDEYNIVVVKVKNAPNPLFDGMADFDAEGADQQDIIDFIEYTIQDALDGGPDE